MLNQQFDPKTDTRMMTLVLEIIEWKIKGTDVLAGLVKWENKVAELERDHKEKLGENIQRAMLMNILPAAMQARIREHLDRLKTYKDIRAKLVTLSHNLAGSADIGNLDNTSDSSSDSWEGWWQCEDGGWHEPEMAEEDPTDIQGLADIKCHVCGGMGHYARSCPSPKPAGGAGKGGKPGAQKGSPKGKCKGGERGKSQQIRPTCGKKGHGNNTCWETFLS